MLTLHCTVLSGIFKKPETGNPPEHFKKIPLVKLIPK